MVRKEISTSMLPYGTIESLRAESLAKWLTQFPSFDAGMKVLGRKPENKTQKVFFQEVKRRMKYYVQPKSK